MTLCLPIGREGIRVDTSIEKAPSMFAIVPVESRTKGIRVIEKQDREIRPPECLRDITSLNTEDFVKYMNTDGWRQGGTFMALLSTMSYHFHEEDGRMVARKWADEVASALSLLIFELLPFDVTMTSLPQPPTEVWEYIIDWVAARSGQPTLHACTLVCRAWRDRSRLHLYKDIRINADHISRFQNTLRNNPSLTLSSTKIINVLCGSGPISALFAISKFANLKYLDLEHLDLTKEHSLIMRGPLSRSVTTLALWDLHSCSAPNLLRFINSFHSLADLTVVFGHSQSLSHNGQILPRPRPISHRSLKHLRLSVVPHIGQLMEWYTREAHFLANVERLRLEWRSGSFKDFDGPMSLSYSYADALEDLTIGTDGHIASVADGILGTVALSSLLNLRRIKWCSDYSDFFQVVATQLCSIRSPCKLAEVGFSISPLGGYGRVKDHCKLIDELLAGDNFPSLCCVQLQPNIPFDYFPNLQSRKLLKVYQ